MTPTTPTPALADLDLLPCPFCGGAARFERNGNWHDLIATHVEDCFLSGDSAEMSYLDSPGVRGRMAFKWNSRAAQPNSPEFGGIAAQPVAPVQADAQGVDDIVTALYRRFKDWSKRGFGPDDVTWCEVKADVMSLIGLRTPSPQIAEVAKLPETVCYGASRPGEMCPCRKCTEWRDHVAASRRAAGGEVEPIDCPECGARWNRITATPAPASAGQAVPAMPVLALSVALSGADCLAMHQYTERLIAWARADAIVSAGQAAPADYTDPMIACSDCGLTFGESRLLGHLKLGKVAVAAQPAEGAGQAGQVADRSKFERECLRHDVLDDDGLRRNEQGDYVDDVAQAAWRAWQLAAPTERAAAPAEQPDDWQAAIAEVERATLKFPTWPTDPLHAVAVLGEEFGELTKAVLQTTYEPHKVQPGELRTEAIQTAAMSLRFLASLGRYEFARSAQHEQGSPHQPSAQKGGEA